jgi:flagellar biosynthetic protein FliP
MVSELGTAFRMGLYIFIPMLLIDILVASVLMSLGMMMVPPQMLSLPLKIGVFLLAGGWHLVVSSLVRSF